MHVVQKLNSISIHVCSHWPWPHGPWGPSLVPTPGKLAANGLPPPPCLWLPFLFMAMALQATTHSCQCDHVVLERCCFTNKYFITSVVSQERVELPSGKHWELDFQGGLGYITSGDEAFWASEFLKARPVYRSGDAWFWKEMRHPGDGQLMEAAQEHMRAVQVR